jgi:hypothetical protein
MANDIISVRKSADRFFRTVCEPLTPVITLGECKLSVGQANTDLIIFEKIHAHASLDGRPSFSGPNPALEIDRHWKGFDQLPMQVQYF